MIDFQRCYPIIEGFVGLAGFILRIAESYGN